MAQIKRSAALNHPKNIILPQFKPEPVLYTPPDERVLEYADTFMHVVTGAVAVLTLLGVIHLWWRHDDTPSQKLLLSLLLLLVPGVGLLFYGYAYKPAPTQNRSLMLRYKQARLPRARVLRDSDDRG